jgi:uncharacterized membrane protein
MEMVATLYEWLLLLHIVAAMVWVGGGVLLAAIAVAILRGRDDDGMERFLRALPVLGPRVLAPATVAVLGLGVWLVLNSAAWSFDQFWVQLAVGLFAAAFVIGAAFQSRSAVLAGRALDDGDRQAAFRHLARWSVVYVLIVALLLVAVWDMVFKPGL